MARFFYECSNTLKDNSEENLTVRSCGSDKFCIFCNAQCCLTLQRRSARHFWETWYFWLGIGLFIIFLISVATSFIISHCKRAGVSDIYRPSYTENSANLDIGDNNNSPQNEIAISIISAIPTHSKVFLMTPQSSCGLLTPIVA